MGEVTRILLRMKAEELRFAGQERAALAYECAASGRPPSRAAVMLAAYDDEAREMARSDTTAHHEGGSDGD